MSPIGNLLSTCTLIYNLTGIPQGLYVPDLGSLLKWVNYYNVANLYN